MRPRAPVAPPTLPVNRANLHPKSLIALCRALAQALGVRPRAVALLAGAKSRRKRVGVKGDPEALRGALDLLASSPVQV